MKICNRTYASFLLYKFIISILVVLYFIISPHIAVHAGITDCIASVNLSNVDANSTHDFILNITNHDPVFNSIRWVKVTRPSSNFTISGASASGWTNSVTSSTAIFNGGVITYNQTKDFSVTATAGTQRADSADWTVNISDSGDGSNPTTCTGTLGTSIIGPAGAVISGVSVGSVTASTALVTWTTDISADSVVLYGTTASYGLSAGSESESVTSHSVSLSGLSALTAYHYKVQSTTGGVTSGSDDGTFTTTLAPSSTPGPSATPTPATTATSTTTIVITPTPIPDNTAPVLSLGALPAGPYRTSPLVTGTALDNQGVTMVEYRLDGSPTWYQVKTLSHAGAASTDFSFTPVLKDGVHTITVRAKDVAGNTSLAKSLTLSVDLTGPILTLTTDFSKPFPEPPEVTGFLEDKSGYGSVEYQLQGKTGWLPVDAVTQETPIKTAWRLKLPPMDDGNYGLSVRATDALGNTSEPQNKTLVIDRLPPVIGALTVMSDRRIVIPDSLGDLLIPAGPSQRLILSVAGGPYSVTGRVRNEETGQDGIQIVFNKQQRNNIWEAVTNFEQPGNYRLYVRAIDGAGWEREADLGVLRVSEAGSVLDRTGMKPVAGAKVTVYAYNKMLSIFELWDAAAEGQSNPQITSPQGKFGMILPPGQYYLDIDKTGFRRTQTTVFNVRTDGLFSRKLLLEKSPVISWGKIRVKLPGFLVGPTVIPINLPSGGTSELRPEENRVNISKIAKAGINFGPEQFIGKLSNLTLLNTWSPQTATQLSILDGLYRHGGEPDLMVVVPLETAADVTLFKNRGGYVIPIIADPNGDIAQNLDYHRSPMHLSINREADVFGIGYGLLTTRQIADDFSQIDEVK